MTKSWNFEVCGNNVVSPFDHLVMYWVLGCAVLMLPILVRGTSVNVTVIL